MKRVPASLLGVLVTAVCLQPRMLHAQSLFDLVPDALDPQACNGQGCWTNHLRLTDMDGDQDLDLLLVNYADFFAGGTKPQPLVVYLNDAFGSFTNASTTAVGNFTGSLRQVAVGDVDGDGSPDLYGPSGDGSAAVLFMNDGHGVFTNEADVRLPPGPYPAAAATRMGDVDSDGDMDIFVSDAYARNGPPFGHLYLNDGTGVFAEAEGAIPVTISGEDLCDAEFMDVDRDLDLDLLVTAHAQGNGALWLNNGSGTFTPGGTLPPPSSSFFHYNMAPCDIDNDGDLDLWIDNAGANATEQLLVNDGRGNFTDETSLRVLGNPTSDDNGVVCVDLDSDGDFDAVVMSLGTAERWLENDGTGHFTYKTGAFPGPTNCTLWGEFGDINGDHRPDLVTGQGECSSSDEVYLANSSVPVDRRDPEVFSVESVPGEVEAGVTPVVRFAVRDGVMSDQGPRVSAYALIGPRGLTWRKDALPMGGDLFRVVLPPADRDPVQFQLCAADPAGNVGCTATSTYVQAKPLTDAGTADAMVADAGTQDDGGAADAATSDAGPVDGSTEGDAAVMDGGTADGATSDAAGVGDSGIPDAATSDDAAVMDGGTAEGDAATSGDAAVLDSGTVDAAMLGDAAVGDGGFQDAGATDSGLADTGTVDASPLDSGHPGTDTHDGGMQTDTSSDDDGEAKGCGCRAQRPGTSPDLAALAIGMLAMFLGVRHRHSKRAPGPAGAN